MQFLFLFLRLFLTLVFVFAINFVFGFFVNAFFLLLKKPKGVKWYIHLRDSRFVKYYDFLKWVIIDTYRGREFELFGVFAFTGFYGDGKSLGCVTYAKKIQKEHGWNIYSNFEIAGQDGKIEKWEDMLELPDRTIIVFDEIQNTFCSTKFKDFPIELLEKLTQCRKDGFAIFCTTPVFARMDIKLRESVSKVVVCHNFLGLKRLFRYEFYKKEYYERYFEDKVRLRMYRDYVLSFVANDHDRSMYDTKQKITKLDIIPKEQRVKIVK